MADLYEREGQLRGKLNSFFESEFNFPHDDYYSRLDLNGFLDLKSVLSGINNIFTFKVTLAFAEWLATTYKLTSETKSLIIKQIRETKPNANGYDIELSQQVNILAEVKCNIPINGGKTYGAQQKSGIMKDINSLILGKSTSSVVVDNYLKFMVFLDLPEIRSATEHLVKNMKKSKDKIVFFDNAVNIKDTQKIYIVFVSF